MYCPNCGTEIPANVTQCPACNTVVNQNAAPAAPTSQVNSQSAPAQVNTQSAPAQPAKTTNGLAITSLILALLGISLPAVICGHIGRKQIRNDPNQTGDGIALGGLIVGYLALAIQMLVVLLYVGLIGFAIISEM